MAGRMFATEILFCARKYSIIATKKKVVLPKVNITFLTEDGFFAAPLPENIDYAEFKNYEGFELQELPFEKEAVFRAGKIERVTPNGFYGRFYKDCIHRAREEREFYYTIRSARWIELRSCRLWSYEGRPIQQIRKGDIMQLPDKNKLFTINSPHRTRTGLAGSIVMVGFYMVGVVMGVENAETGEYKCVAAEVLLREMYEHKEYIKAAIAAGELVDEPDPEFIIHKGVLEKYQGDERTVVIPQGVHTIGERAFYDNRNIQNVIFPESLRKIEDSAFEGCLLLQDLQFPTGLKKIGDRAFEMCRSLQHANIPNSVTYIGSSAFGNCEKLESVVLPSMLKSIEGWAFHSCANLRAMLIPGTVKRIEEFAFCDCKRLSDIQLPASVTVATCAFDRTAWIKKHLRKNGSLVLGGKILLVSEKLTEYTIPSNVHTIGRFAFSKSNIKALHIPETVKVIESYAFAGSNIKNIKLPKSIKKIEDWTFADCKQLEELTIPKSVNSIGSCALYNLPSCVVTILNADEDVEGIGDFSFGWDTKVACVKHVRVPFGSAAMRGARVWNLPCTYLEGSPKRYVYNDDVFCCDGTTLVQYLGHQDTVIIPEGITAIADYAFAENYGGAKQIILPKSVISIGQGAFLRCRSLKEILGEGVVEIGCSAFFEATRLMKAYFPNLVEMKRDAFQGCESLNKEGLIIPQSLHNLVFENTDKYKF